MQLHKRATTTPHRRTYIQSSPLPISPLATEPGAPKDTMRRWKKRNTVEDHSHTAHHLQTTLTPAQKVMVTALYSTLWLLLNELLVVGVH